MGTVVHKLASSFHSGSFVIIGETDMKQINEQKAGEYEEVGSLAKKSKEVFPRWHPKGEKEQTKGGIGRGR